MNGHLLQIRIVFSAFEPFGCVLFVLCGDVARHTCYATLSLFGALEDDLNPDFFLCHTALIEFTGGNGGLERAVESQLVDVFHTGRGNF